MPETATHLFQQIKAGNRIAFDKLFQFFYEKLVHQAYKTTQSQSDAEDIVQSVFINFWTKRKEIIIQQSVEGYLQKMVYHRCMDYFRKQKNKKRHQEKYTLQSLHLNIDSPEEDLLKTESLAAIYQKIEALPPKCKIVFKMSRFEELSYEEIAEQLGISKKTVEYHISTALRVLRKSVFGIMLFSIIEVIR